MAEEEGLEPPRAFRPQRFSRPPDYHYHILPKWRRDWESNPERLLTPRLSKPLEYHYRTSPMAIVWHEHGQSGGWSENRTHMCRYDTPAFEAGPLPFRRIHPWRRVSDSNGQFQLRSRTSDAVHYHSAQLSNAPGISSRQLDGRFRVPIESNYLSWSRKILWIGTGYPSRILFVSNKIPRRDLFCPLHKTDCEFLENGTSGGT